MLIISFKCGKNEIKGVTIIRKLPHLFVDSKEGGRKWSQTSLLSYLHANQTTLFASFLLRREKGRMFLSPFYIFYSPFQTYLLRGRFSENKNKRVSSLFILDYYIILYKSEEQFSYQRMTFIVWM